MNARHRSRVLQMDAWRLRQAVETHGLAWRFAGAGSLAAPGLPAGLGGSGAVSVAALSCCLPPPQPGAAGIASSATSHVLKEV